MGSHPAIDTARDACAFWCSNPGPPENDPVIYDILDRNIVLNTILVSIVLIGNTDPNQKPWIIASKVLKSKDMDG